MVTGDDRATAEAVARGVGVDEVFADCRRREDKLAVLRRVHEPSRRRGRS